MSENDFVKNLNQENKRIYKKIPQSTKNFITLINQREARLGLGIGFLFVGLSLIGFFMKYFAQNLIKGFIPRVHVPIINMNMYQIIRMIIMLIIIFIIIFICTQHFINKSEPYSCDQETTDDDDHKNFVNFVKKLTCQDWYNWICLILLCILCLLYLSCSGHVFIGSLKSGKSSGVLSRIAKILLTVFSAGVIVIFAFLLGGYGLKVDASFKKDSKVVEEKIHGELINMLLTKPSDGLINKINNPNKDTDEIIRDANEITT